MPENNELSQKNQSFSNIKMPAIIDFYELTGIKRFNGKEYSKLQEEEDRIFEEKLREFESYKRLRASYKVLPNWVFIILGIIVFFVVYVGSMLIFVRFSRNFDFPSHIMLVSILTSIAIPVILRLFLKNRLKNLKKINQPKQNNVIDKKKYEFFSKIFDTIKNIHLQNFRILHIFHCEKLFFGNEGCALVNVESGRIILYGKENIKNVLLEHKHLGSSTVGSSFNSGGMDSDGQLIFHVHRNVSIAGNSHYDTYEESEHESETTEYYEWHLDILTDFMEYPSLSFVIDDDDLGSVKEAKVIYGIFGK